MRNSLHVWDSQETLAFLIPQLSHIEREVYSIQYPAIRYHSIVPVATEGNPWMPTVTYFSMDGVGQAEWFNANALDVPNADINRNKFQTSVEMAAIGYRYNTEELMQASELGINLTSEKAAVARRVAEEKIDQATLFGDADKGFTGLLNSTAVSSTLAPANGGGNSSLWANKTPAQIMADINAALSGIFTSTNTVELADTLLLPVTAYLLIATTPFNAYTEKTILDYIREHNVYTAETGRRLNVRSVRGLDTAGAGNSGRCVAYRKSPEVVKVHIPMPFRFLSQPFQRGPMVWEIPGIFRFGGTDIRLPKAFVYLDGVC